MNLLHTYWNEMPAVRWLFAFVLGITCCIYLVHYQLLSAPQLLPPAIAITLIFSLLLALFSNRKNPIKYFQEKFFRGALIHGVLFFLGFTMTLLKTEKNLKTHFSENLHSSNVSFLAKIIEPPVLKEKIVVTTVEVMMAKDSNETKSVTGKVLLNMEKDSSSLHLKYGQIICFHKNPSHIEPPKNPEEFDYRLYQCFHNVFHKAYLRSSEWQITAQFDGYHWLSEVYKMRDYLLSLLIDKVKGKDDLAVATAILLGYRDYMTADVIQAYSSSGALHVLSVSGLHVGIVFLILQLFLGWMEKSKNLKILRAAIIIFVIGFYAIITGMSPSVMRAFVMFSLIIIAKTIDRDVSTYNVLATSCFLLLLWNPYLITEVGFKLSYLAVLGIVFLHPLIYSQKVYENWLLDKAWGIVSISIAAQVATFPLSVLYFHQFPVLFIISNLIVIPLSNAVLILGMVLFVCSPLKILYDFVGFAFNFFLTGLNKIVFVFDKIPYSLIKGLVITQTEMWLIYLLIVLICWLLIEPKTKVLLSCLFLILILSSVHLLESFNKINQDQFVIYSVKNSSAIALIHHQNVHYKFDSLLENNESAKMFHVTHHWWERGIKEKIKLDSSAFCKKFSLGNLITFNQKTILILDKTLPKLADSLSRKLKVNYVVLSHTPKVYVENLCKAVEFDTLIFDSSNKNRIKKYWKRDCEKMEIPFIDCEQACFLRNW